MQVGFNCLLSHKGVMLLMLPLTNKGFNSLLLMYINIYGLMHMLTVKPLRCISTLWLGKYVRYTPCTMLDLPYIESRIATGTYYTSPRQSRGRVLITKISYSYCDITITSIPLKPYFKGIKYTV